MPMAHPVLPFGNRPPALNPCVLLFALFATTTAAHGQLATARQLMELTRVASRWIVPCAKYSLGCQRHRAGQPSEAIAAFAEAVETAPGDEFRVQALCGIIRSQLALGSAHYEAARRSVHRVQGIVTRAGLSARWFDTVTLWGLRVRVRRGEHVDHAIRASINATKHRTPDVCGELRLLLGTYLLRHRPRDARSFLDRLIRVPDLRSRACAGLGASILATARSPEERRLAMEYCLRAVVAADRSGIDVDDSERALALCAGVRAMRALAHESPELRTHARALLAELFATFPHYGEW